MIEVFLDRKFSAPISREVMDVKNPTDFANYEVQENYFDLSPGAFVLGVSSNTIAVPTGFIGIVMARSTYLRAGLYFGCGFVQPGWFNPLVLELCNLLMARSLRLYLDEPIAKVELFPSDSPIYTGKYSVNNPLRPKW